MITVPFNDALFKFVIVITDDVDAAVALTDIPGVVLLPPITLTITTDVAAISLLVNVITSVPYWAVVNDVVVITPDCLLIVTALLDSMPVPLSKSIDAAAANC